MEKIISTDTLNTCLAKGNECEISGPRYEEYGVLGLDDF